MVYLVTYDLNKSGQNYQLLFEAIKNQGNALHALQNLWFIETDKSASQIYQNLKAVIDKNDYILISQINLNHMGFLPNNVVNWLSGKI